MFLTAINLPTSILSTLIGAAPGVFIAMTGYHEHTDDVDDDQIGQLYDWTSNTLWMLRILGSIVCPVLALAAFAVMRNYALRDKIVMKMNDVIKSNEEKEKEFATLDRDRGDESITGDALSVEHKQYFMHLSLEEIGVLTNDRVRIGLDNLKSYSLFNCAVALGCCVLILAVLCIDIIEGQGSFTTLFITLLLLCLFYSMYEYFRVLAMTDMASRYTPEQFNVFANECYVEYSHYHESLKQLLKKHGIHFTDAMSMSTSGSVSLFSPIIEENTKPDRVSGHKRFYFCAACIVGLSIAIGCVILI
jgi:phosphate/sulfate permease